ncbi:hypothetical protein CJF30_00009390 [Rutstroemia sp. NJR-2017a BBW]|nr:hypothetical protein CJF30_00009390 [Rutstroemia sp. NJR-2017a BBW]
MSRTKRYWGGPEVRKQKKEERLQRRKEERLKKRGLTESPTTSKSEEFPKKKHKRSHSDVSTDDGEPWMTGGLSTLALLASSEAPGEQIDDHVIEKTHKKKKIKQSHAVEPEAEAQSENAPPVTPTKVSCSYPPILPPPSPFARKRVTEAQTLKAEYPTPILPPKYTQHASNRSGNVAEAETSSARNDDKVPIDFYTQDWEESVGYVRANVKRNMDEESQTEENVAFSKNYLSDPVRSETGINVAGVNFRTLILLQGRGQHSTIASTGQPALQICVVGRGRVTVFLDEQRFDIGEGGMWRVKVSETCVVKQRGRKKGIVYITSVPAVQESFSIHLRKDIVGSS